jgi:hypothetical protein
MLVFRNASTLHLPFWKSFFPMDALHRTCLYRLLDLIHRTALGKNYLRDTGTIIHAKNVGANFFACPTRDAIIFVNDYDFAHFGFPLVVYEEISSVWSSFTGIVMH